MRVNGEPDPEYVLARRVLLDALEALDVHRDSIILVGAQAVYFHTGSAGIAVPEYTTDADLALDTRALQPYPRLDELLAAANFRRGKNPGTWIGGGDVEVDLLVSESFGGRGRRGARLTDHGNHVARKAKGLEAALVDHVRLRIGSLEPEVDDRFYEVRVARPAALLVAKLHKITDRAGSPGRAEDKDALDVLRLLQAVTTDDLAATLRLLLNQAIASNVTRDAIQYLDELFAKPGGLGAEMAARAVVPLEDPETIKASCAALAADLVAALIV